MSGLRLSCRSTAKRYLQKSNTTGAISISSLEKSLLYSTCTSSKTSIRRDDPKNINSPYLSEYNTFSSFVVASRQYNSFRIAQSKRSFSRNAILQQTTQKADGAKIVDYLLADVGEGITECEIVKWFAEPGTRVEEFDNLVEVQSDKASVEITSRYTGTVIEHCYQVGQVAKVGSPLCRIQLESVQNLIEKSDEQDHSNEAKDLNEEKHEKANHQVQGFETKENSEPSLSSSRFATLATPAVRRLTRENDIQIDKIRGTGKDGRVTKEDVQQFIASKSQDKQKTSDSESSNQAIMNSNLVTDTIPITGVRKAMFKAMSNTWTAPHFGYSDEIDITALEAMRKRIVKASGKGVQSNEEVKLTLLPFLLKALSITLNDHPLFRSILDTQSMTLKQAKEHRISIAFASSKGLLTPTLQGDVRSLSINDIARQIGNLQSIGASRNLTQSETGSGATITLSNIGSIGGTHTFPLIPPTGQMIIGAVGRARILPRFEGDPENGKVRPATILPISFSADHRIVEGIELANFVNDWKRLLEDPMSWIVKMH